jgi:predicted Zn-dependent peptidase
VHRVPLPGTRAVTVLVAFEAGARTERPEESGMAYLLEHVVLSGGRKYPTSRKISAAGDAIGAVLGADTSHDLVIFHITARAEAAGEAIDLLTDFAGRPRLDAGDIERARHIVLRQIARTKDEPELAADVLIGRAAFGDHPLGRAVVGSAEHVGTFTRDAIVAFRRRQWAGARGGAFVVGNLDHVPDDAALLELFGRFPSLAGDGSYEPAPNLPPQTLVDERDSNQSHLRMSYRTAITATDERARAALAVYVTLLGGSNGSRLVDQIREQHGLAYSIYAAERTSADAALLELSAGVDSGRCVEAYVRMREIVDDLRVRGPRADEFERAKAYTAGYRLLALEDTRFVAIHAALRAVVFRDAIDPLRDIRALDEVTIKDVAEIAQGVSEAPAVACVGPHSADDFRGVVTNPR